MSVRGLIVPIVFAILLVDLVLVMDEILANPLNGIENGGGATDAGPYSLIIREARSNRPGVSFLFICLYFCGVHAFFLQAKSAERLRVEQIENAVSK